MKTILNGFYIVIEGPDGSGKTTQCQLLYDKLSGEYEVSRVREPGGTPFGDKIRAILLNKGEEELSSTSELFLFSAARNHSIERIVMPALAQGKIVLSDRNYFSTEAYQGAGGNIDVETIRAVSRIATLGMEPNLSFIVDIDVKEGLRRARRDNGGDKIQSRNLDYHQRVRDAYLEIAQRERCTLINGMRTPDDIHDEIYKIVKSQIITRTT